MEIRTVQGVVRIVGTKKQRKGFFRLEIGVVWSPYISIRISTISKWLSPREIPCKKKKNNTLSCERCLKWNFMITPQDLSHEVRKLTPVLLAFTQSLSLTTDIHRKPMSYNWHAHKAYVLQLTFTQSLRLTTDIHTKPKSYNWHSQKAYVLQLTCTQSLSLTTDIHTKPKSYN